MSAPVNFPGTPVPLTTKSVAAFESLSAYVAAGGNPAVWVRDNIAFTGRCAVQTSGGEVETCPTCGLVLMGDECDSCEGGASELHEGRA
jgi:hypothetical protein